MRSNFKATFYPKENCSFRDLAHETMIDLREEESFELEMKAS